MGDLQYKPRQIDAVRGGLAVPVCRVADASLRTTLRAWLAAHGCLLFALVQGCGDAPPLPDDEDHRDATVDECIECHVDGDGRRPPSGHFEDGEIKQKKQDCYGCHELPE